MNEKFSLLKSLLLLASFNFCQGGGPVFKTISQAHHSLSKLRARCFYVSHADLPWDKKGTDIGFLRQSDGKFYKLIEREIDDE